jgi:hypothetical protein
MSMEGVLEGTDPREVWVSRKKRITKGTEVHHCASCEGEMKERKTKFFLYDVRGGSKQMFICDRCMSRPGPELKIIIDSCKRSKPQGDT